MKSMSTRRDALSGVLAAMGKAILSPPPRGRPALKSFLKAFKRLAKQLKVTATVENTLLGG
jgi:hypothetical protein